MIEPAAEEMLSPSRLEPYRRFGGTEQRAWELYLWNSELSTSYIQALGWMDSDYRAMVEDLCTLPEVASRQR